jgi:chromatin assembly factor 1 subunit A
VRDEDQLDYEYDSEAEWEDPEDGEDLKSDDDEDDEEVQEKFDLDAYCLSNSILI